MNTLKATLLSIGVILALVFAAAPGEAAVQKEHNTLDVTFSSGGIEFTPRVACRQLEVTVSAPNGDITRETIMAGGNGFISLEQLQGKSLQDGVYTYEAVLVGNEGLAKKEQTRSGYFRVESQKILPSGDKPEPHDIVILPEEYFVGNVYIRGKLGVGSDMTDGASMPFETILMRQNNCQILFDDSSTSASFAQNDWRIKANDTFSGGADYFAIEDDTNNTTPFTIQAEAPDNTLYLDSQGDVGIGTSTPASNLHILDTGNAYFKLERSTGAQVEMYAGSSSSYFGTRDNFKLYLMTNSTFRMTIGNTGNIGIGVISPTHLLDVNGGAYCNGTSWVNASSREFKENIAELPEQEALNTLKSLKPVTFNYKEQKDETCVGFIAEDVPELVATKDRKGLGAMDVVAVLTRVVQQQQKQLEEQGKLIRQLQAQMDRDSQD